MDSGEQDVHRKEIIPKRIWDQYSLRSLLLFVTLVAFGCSWFAVKMGQAKRQRQAVKAFKKAGGLVGYDYAAYRCGSSGIVYSGGIPHDPEWLIKLLGNDFFHNVTLVQGIHFSECENVNILGVSYVQERILPMPI
jgi:hypothetical protein